MKKWTKAFLLVIAVVSVISVMSMTAFAAEENMIEETFSGVEIPVGETTEEETTEVENSSTTPEETTEPSETDDKTVTDDTETEVPNESVDMDVEDKSDDAFSVEGNGEVLDNVMDEKSGKEFYTIVTANNNTYYLIIDHASSSKNVYMLSMIDEDDLKEFLSKEEPEVPEDTGTTPTVDFGDEQSGGDKSSDDGTSEEPKKDNNILGTILIILVLGAIAGGGYFYFKIYKPKKEAQIADEDMEYVDEGVTINEDEDADVNADTSVEELSFEDDESDTYNYDEE